MIITNPPRDIQDYKELSRNPALNHLKTELTKKPRYKRFEFYSSLIFKWVYHTFKSGFGRKYKYPTYTTRSGIYEVPSDDAIQISITGDWATDTKESISIANIIRDIDPEYTIHIGDTYYVGEPKEIAANFLPIENSNWHRGRMGSFALLGNHEMYAKGDSFFEDLLPSMGLRTATGFGGQEAAYFCLENSSWRILGLDTGYNSVSKPLAIDFLFHISNCHFEQALIDWLEDVVKLGDKDDKRGIVILTHHQYISAFEREYNRPAEQLAKLLGIDRPIIWLFGHEHKLAIYDKAQVGSGVTAYCRCVGHGGMPIELESKEFNPNCKKNGYSKLLAFDRRGKRTSGNVLLGYNGFCNLKLEGADLKLEYIDKYSNVIANEEWVANSNGWIQQTYSDFSQIKCRL